jgi:type II secretory pathway predicted ATPase ExeA
MSEASTLLSDEELSKLVDNLGYVLETRALLCVTAADGLLGEAVVEAALGRLEHADPVVASAAPGNSAELLDAFYAALHLDHHGVRPRRLADAQQAVEAELARLSRPVVVVRDAHLLRTEALQYLYWLWTFFQEREQRLPVVLVGPERLRSVLSRPSLASLKSCVYIWHRLTR